MHAVDSNLTNRLDMECILRGSGLLKVIYPFFWIRHHHMTVQEGVWAMLTKALYDGRPNGYVWHKMAEIEY
jgi:hypothetical protein